MRVLAICALLLVPSAAIAGPPTDTFKAFLQAAQRSDFESAWSHVASFEGVPEPVAAELLQHVREIVELAAEGWGYETIDEKIVEGCAVVVLRDSKNPDDLDPAYLIKQEDGWRLFPDFTEWEIAEHVAKEKVGALTKLQEWYKGRKSSIKAPPQSEANKTVDTDA